MIENDDEYWRSLPTEEKLNSLRNEMVSSIDSIRIIATMLKSIDLEKTKGLPDQFGFWVNSLEKAGDHLKDTLDLFTK